MNASRFISFAFIYLSLISKKNLVFSSDVDEAEDQSATSAILEAGSALGGDGATLASEDVAESVAETVAADPETQVAPDENLTNEPDGSQADEGVVALAEGALTDDVAPDANPAEVVPESEHPTVEDHAEPAPADPKVPKVVELDVLKPASSRFFTHSYDTKYHLHKFTCNPGYVIGLVKESFGLGDLEILHNDPFYKFLAHMKSHDASRFHSINMVDGAYSWDDTLVLLDRQKSAEDPVSLFVTLEVDKLEANTHIDYAFVEGENLHVFAANNPFIIDNVKLHGESLWAYDDNVNDKKFPFSVEFNGSDKLEIGFEDFFLMFSYEQANWKFEKYFYENQDIVEVAEDEEDAAEGMGEDQVAEQPAAEEPVKATVEVVEVKENEDVVSEEAPKPEEAVVEAEKPLDEGHVAEAAPVVVADDAVAVPEPEHLLDDHVVSALEFIWKPAFDELTGLPRVFAEHVYVRVSDMEKTLYIFFNDKTMRRFHRVGRCGPWREWVPPARRAIMAA